LDGIITLITPSQPVWISRSGTIIYGELLDGSIDWISHEASPFIRPGEVYEVRSSLPGVSQKELREAGTDYPEWIVQNYLQIPESITPRTRTLAQRITDGFDTPYEKAEAITVFLRSNIEYSPIIDTPPEEQDLVDWFIFDYRKGFCNYYSTAEIILLRLSGIPARWAMGYAEGQREAEAEFIPLRGNEELMLQIMPEKVNFIIRSLDAHSWPEVYFPDIGWVEFEPTVSQTPILRPTGSLLDGEPDLDPSSSLLRDLPQLDDQDDGGFTDRSQSESTLTTRRLVVGILISAIVVVSIGIIAFATRKSPRMTAWWKKMFAGQVTPIPVRLETSLKRMGFNPPMVLQRWAEYSLLSGLSKAYLEINRALSRLGALLPLSATPAERVEQLVGILPLAVDPAHRLLNEYELSIYSSYPGNPEAAKNAGAEIRKLSVQAKMRNIAAIIKKRLTIKSRMP
jgi:transglutaminase-like putative cysteine protease